MNGIRTENRPVLIAGGGIGGLAVALTLHQIGVPCIVFESVKEVQALGVGINLQPNAVRELYDLGFDRELLNSVGIPVQEWALVGLNGKEIYSEPRGTKAGYHWPQYAVHRGRLQMLMYHAVCERLGQDAIRTGHKVTGYRNDVNNKGVIVCVETRDKQSLEIEGALLIAADGLHSAVRAQMYPDQPPIRWGGSVMWRGTSQLAPIRTGASFVGLGTHDHRLVFYPITPADPQTGLATINWIAEITIDNSAGWISGEWNKQVDLDHFLPYFADWNYDWLDVPAMLSKASAVYEYPMIDRDPVPSWVDGNVALLGDAAHVMYPVGSNGASQAIVDARVLGAAVLKYGASMDAVTSYNEELCDDVSKLVLRNRGAGPFGILNIVEERCGGNFNDISEVISPDEIEAYMAQYKRAAGFSMEALNNSPQTIAVDPESQRSYSYGRPKA